MNSQKVAYLMERVNVLTDALIEQNERICQILGKVLGYPWYKDDPKNFPDATEEHGVCVGECVAEDCAHAAAERIAELRATIATHQEIMAAMDAHFDVFVAHWESSRNARKHLR